MVKKIEKGIGDDAAIFNNFIITTDTYAEGVHFDFSYLSPREIGRKVTCGALSDICAMGGEPLLITISIASPNIEWKVFQRIFKGIEDVCKKYKVEIAGGDIIFCGVLVINITAVGKGGKFITREGAKPGDYLYITGYPGLSEVGRILLKKKIKGFSILKKRHKFPELRFSVIKKIKKYINAMIDTSDGVSKDLLSIAEKSNVKVIIEKEKLPLHPELLKASLLLKKDPYLFALHGGEDYELIFTSSRELENISSTITKIGYVEKGRGVFLKERGKICALPIKGYQHF